MPSHLIFWPVLAQLLIPILVLLLNGKRKADDVKAGKHDPGKSAMNNKAWSDPVVLTSNNLANQFQLPVIFYVLCLVLFQLDAVTAANLSVAVLFVVTRYVHAYIHVTSNYVPVRMRVFMIGALLLLVLFGMTAWALAGI